MAKHPLTASLVAAVAAVALVALAGFGAAAPPTGQAAKLTPTNEVAGGLFGDVVALDGTTAAIGMPFDNALGQESGSVSVYALVDNAWTLQAKLLAPDGGPNDRFGCSVSLSGDTLVVGAKFDDDTAGNSGAAYVFTRSGTSWTLQGKLLAADGVASDYFGHVVSVDGDTALITAPGDDGSMGSAYVFTRSGTSWTQQAKLVAADRAASDVFGFSAALSGNTAILSSPWDNAKGESSGSAYVYTRTGTTWAQQTKIVPADGAKDDLFGHAVTLQGDTAVVGALFDDEAVANSGSAYVYVRSGTTWTQQAKLIPADVAGFDLFGGISLSLSGNTLLAGARGDDDKGSDSGSVHVFERSGTSWTRVAKLVAPDGAAGDMFGTAVAVDGEVALIGASWDDGSRVNSGSAYVFAPDGDGDGVANVADNCPTTANANQLNTDGDAMGDACDPDDDNDGVADTTDAFPRDPTETRDNDRDGVGDNADTDDDNDGIPDSGDADADGDGETDVAACAGIEEPVAMVTCIVDDVVARAQGLLP